MTEATDHSLPNLSLAASRLGGVFARPKRIAVMCVIVLVGLGWLYLGLLTASMAGPRRHVGRRRHGLPLCGFTFGVALMPDGVWGVTGFALVALMWAAMTLAMMLPSAAPMILTYAEIADTAARKGEHVVSPFVLAAGYAAGLVRLRCAGDGCAICADARRAFSTEHGFGQRPVLRRDVHRRRRLSVLRAQACLSAAMPFAIPILFHQLGDDAARRCSGSVCARACSASAAAGR